MHAARAGLILAVLGCSPPKGLWRDQSIFVGDDGTVLALGVHRRSTGEGEAKGWLGEDGSWRSNFYHRFRVTGAEARDVSAALRVFSSGVGVPARVSLERRGETVSIRLRTPSASLRVVSRSLDRLGRTEDPEGTSVYRAGRASLSTGSRRREGWLLAEETPKDRPRRPSVDYGDFVFVVAAAPGRGLLVLKRSRGREGFDHAFVRKTAVIRHTKAVRAEVDGDRVVVELSRPSLRADLAVRDRRTVRSVSAAGRRVVYETLLLGGGGEYAGVAFVIRPHRRRDGG